MKRVTILTLSLALVVGTTRTAVSAQADTTHQRPEIRTAASVSRGVRPDLALFTISFNATGPTPLAAGRAVAARADSLRTALTKLGIPRDSLISGSSWYWWRGRVDLIVGSHSKPGPVDARGNPTWITVQDTTYRVSDAINVRIRDLRVVGPAIDTVLAHHVLDISAVQFQATSVAAAQEAALRDATERARRQASAIAEASGGHLGRALVLTTLGEEYDRYSPGLLTLSGATVASPGGAPGGTQVIEPSIPVSVTVYGRWEFIAQP